ncbi:MAG: class I SAM-dependent methyltransferase [Nitrososphaerales archaeon]
MTRSVKQFYSGYVDKEWARFLRDPYHRLEFDTTLEFLRRYLPKDGLILDAGGGPGRYTIELAKKGHDVVLLDFTPANLKFAKKQIEKEGVGSKVKGIVEGSIVNLARFSDDTFDAVLCLGGPLSHVMREHNRKKAIAELVRVARRNSPIFISVIGRLGVLATELRYFQEEIQLPLFKRVRDEGDYFGERNFTATHFFLPEELGESVERIRGVEVLEMVGLQGIGSVHKEEVNELARNKRRWRVWLETHYKTCTHPSVVGLSEHMLVVCKKRELGTAKTKKDPAV